MLGTSTPLIFPTLRIEKAETTVRGHKTDTPLYRLNWEDFQRKLEKSAATGRPRPLPEALPPPLKLELNAARFAIPPEYMTEINRHSIAAQTFWGIFPPFDTIIREMTLEPVFSHVRVAFELIADCTFTADKGELTRARWTVPILFELHFWISQTGLGVAIERARKEVAEMRRNPHSVEVRSDGDLLHDLLEPHFRLLEGTIREENPPTFA